MVCNKRAPLTSRKLLEKFSGVLYTRYSFIINNNTAISFIITFLPYRGKTGQVLTRDRPINRTYRLIAHSTSDFDDRLQFYKIDYSESFLKK